MQDFFTISQLHSHNSFFQTKYIYIYIILYVIVTIILRLIINNTEVWLAWIACIIPLGYMILTVLWGLYVSAKYNICKYLKERRTKKGKQDK